MDRTQATGQVDQRTLRRDRHATRGTRTVPGRRTSTGMGVGAERLSLGSRTSRSLHAEARATSEREGRGRARRRAQPPQPARPGRHRANHGGTWPKWSSLPPTPRLLDRIGVSPETDGSRLVRRGAAVARSRTALSRCGQRERRATLNAWATRSTRTPFVRTADVVSNPMPGTSSTPVSRWTSPHSASLTTSWMEREDSSIRSARRRTPDTRAVHGRTPERLGRPNLSARCRRSTPCTSIGRLAAL
jgi:hypothetical protein